MLQLILNRIRYHLTELLVSSTYTGVEAFLDFSKVPVIFLARSTVVSFWAFSVQCSSRMLVVFPQSFFGSRGFTVAVIGTSYFSWIGKDVLKGQELIKVYALGTAWKRKGTG